METFIVRIYHRFLSKPENIVGITENVETGAKKRFENVQQLSGIILDSESTSKQNKHLNNPKKGEPG
jgi:hypothetical protein